MPAWQRYLVAQIPGAVLVGVGLWLFWGQTGLPGWAGVLFFLFWIGKDVLLYPLMRRAYESSEVRAQRLVGLRGVARADLAPDGQVDVQGEAWRARAPRLALHVDLSVRREVRTRDAAQAHEPLCAHLRRLVRAAHQRVEQHVLADPEEEEEHAGPARKAGLAPEEPQPDADQNGAGDLCDEVALPRGHDGVVAADMPGRQHWTARSRRRTTAASWRPPRALRAPAARDRRGSGRGWRSSGSASPSAS